MVLGCLTITDDVAILCVYEFLVNADRLGAVLDELLNNYHDIEIVTPSVLRRKLLVLAASLRAAKLLRSSVSLLPTSSW